MAADKTRNEAVFALLSELFQTRSGETDSAAIELEHDDTRGVFYALVGGLADDPPTASQAAEAALVLAAFSLVENQVLDLSVRIAGDRGAGDKFCREILEPRNIPATKGPLQSSSYRAGYASPQVRSDSLRLFVVWQSVAGRTVADIRELATALVDAFLRCAASMPSLPALVASRFTFVAYRQARDALLAEGSQGAFEQYLLAGLLLEELATTSSGLKAYTKNVGANDSASGAAGDVEIRHGHALRGAVEVTAASWRDKLDQLPAVAAAGLSDALIVAPDVTDASTGAELAEVVTPIGDRLGLDVAVLNLYGLMDVAASRISKAARAEAFRFVYQCLARFHRREPHLAERLIAALSDLGLTSTDDLTTPQEASLVDLDEVVERLRSALAPDELSGDPRIPTALRELATSIEQDSAED